jgi:hypothetical protein
MDRLIIMALKGLFRFALGAYALACIPVAQAAVRIEPEVLSAASRGVTQLVFIELDDSDVARQAKARLTAGGRRLDASAYIASIKTENKQAIEGYIGRLSSMGVKVRGSITEFPLVFATIVNRAQLDRVVAHPKVKAVYFNRVPVIVDIDELPTESGQLVVRQPQVAAAGYTGLGTSIAVIDNRFDLDFPGFSFDEEQLQCRRPSDPSSFGAFPLGNGNCRVRYAQSFSTNNCWYSSCFPTTWGKVNPAHGTTVGATAGLNAPRAGLILLSAAQSDGVLSVQAIMSAIGWVVSNAPAYNIVSLNLSFADENQKFAGVCYGTLYDAPVARLREMGVITVAGSGNWKWSDGLPMPACAPQVLSVGGTYAGNFGWNCNTDAYASPGAVDNVACFSNASRRLDVLAPADVALLSSFAGHNYSALGTSVAAPFVSGAIAALKSAGPSGAEDPEGTISRLLGGGVAIRDSRNGLTFPRLNELNAATYIGPKIQQSYIKSQTTVEAVVQAILMDDL